MNRRILSGFDFTLTGEVTLSSTCFKMEEWLSRRLYIIIGGILGFRSGDFGGALFTSVSESLSEKPRTVWAKRRSEKLCCTSVNNLFSVLEVG